MFNIQDLIVLVNVINTRKESSIVLYSIAVYVDLFHVYMIHYFVHCNSF